ncbi:MAG: adenylate/guanylate cyclase domain-containing protein [Treponema sp.]|nr:adenylate/guanylate cyclase domain-containing protein [Candidatus Treponema merdequi]
MKRVLAFLFFSIFLIPLYSQTICNSSGTGLIVTDSSYAEKKLISLNCKWDFFDKAFIPGDVFYKNGSIQKYDLDWYNGIEVSLPHHLVNEKGYATYHCCIRNLKANKDYALLIYKNVFTSADIYVNSVEVFSNGTVSASPFFKSRRMVRQVEFKSDRNGIADLVYHVSNHELSQGGILLIPKIGEVEVVQRNLFYNICFEVIISAAILILLLYNLMIFLLNSSQKMYLVLVLLCIDLICIVCSLEFPLFNYFFDGISTVASYKFSLISLAIMFPLYNIYIIRLYNIDFKLNKIAIILTFFVLCVVVFVPLQYLSQYLIYLFSIAYCCSFYLLILILAKRKKPEYMYYINAVIIIPMLISGIYGFLFVSYTPEGNYGLSFFKVTILLFAIVQTVLAGAKRDALSEEIQVILKQYEQKNNSLSRFIPKNVINYLQIENIHDINSGDNSICEGMILVCDIRHFNEITANLETKKAFTLLSDYYNIVSIVVKAHGGFIIKYLGDGIIAFFPDKNENVCKAAVEIQKQIKDYDKQFSLESVLRIKVGIGIHVGKVAVGFMGDKNYLQSVSCSENIRYAIEIESKNKNFDSGILISERALNFCRNYDGCMFEGVITEFESEKTLLYKVIPFENVNYGFKYPGEKI